MIKKKNTKVNNQDGSSTIKETYSINKQLKRKIYNNEYSKIST